MATSRTRVERRVAGFSEMLAIALLGASFLCAWLRLPAFAPNLAFRFRSSPLAAQFSAWGPELSWVVECLALCAGLLGFQVALGRFGLSRLRLSRILAGAVTCLVIVAALASLSVSLKIRAVFVPVGLGALWMSASFGLGTGLLTVITSVAFCALMGVSGVLSAPLLVRAVAVVLFFRDGKRPQDGLRAGVLAGLLSALVDVSMNVGQTTVWWELLIIGLWDLAGGASEGVLYMVTRGAGERLLGHVSRERLVALLDLSQPLLQRMIHRAPGSFEHSRAMANLAEQAASAIGADALLTRVGAYYHDLGKSIEPKFFVENLEPGEPSPHDGLDPGESADHIVRHVTEGVAILRAGGIPEAVVEFAYTHHGTQFVEYFLNKQRRLAGDAAVLTERFGYPGMKPKTLETAILMLVDSIEAASRTIDAPDRERFDDMVRRIVFSKLTAGQLDDSGLTLKQLRVVCGRVAETLVHMNHHRIKYPWQEERARQFGVGNDELSPGDQRKKLSAISIVN